MARRVDGYLTHGAISVDTHLHVVKVGVYDDIIHPGTFRELLISPKTAADLARNLLGAAHAAMARQLLDARCGECSTCGNSRMVNIVRPGHPKGTLEHCSDCTPQPIPVMANWAETMAAVRK